MDLVPEAIVADPFGQIRARCARVAADAQHVQIDAAALDRYADALPVSEVLQPGATRFPNLPDAESLAAYVITLDAINFGSGWFPLLRKPAGLSGYRTVESALLRRFESDGPFDAAQLSAMQTSDVTRLLGQDPADAVLAELMTLFAQALRDLGELLSRDHAGSFLALVDAAAGSATQLLRSLVQMPLYRDVVRYRDYDVPFFKRAQITAADLALALPEHAAFRDLDQLTIFADNLVPHVLRLDGVLHFEAGLVERIERGELVVAGSAEEVEIRACGVHAVERIVARLRESEPRVRAANLDFWLWSRGGGPRYKARPRHRARCAYY